VSENQVQRPRHLREIEGVDEQARVPDLSASAAAEPAPKLLLGSPTLPRRLLLESAERSKVPLSLGDPFHGGSAERADQLVLQICDAHVEAQPFHVGASEVGAESSSFETPTEIQLLSRVTETCQPHVKPVRAELIQKPSDGLRASDRNDGYALGAQIPATPLGERFERELVADPLDEHHCSRPSGIHVCIFTALAKRLRLDER